MPCLHSSHTAVACLLPVAPVFLTAEPAGTTAPAWVSSVMLSELKTVLEFQFHSNAT